MGICPINVQREKDGLRGRKREGEYRRWTVYYKESSLSVLLSFDIY
jgi:hypothetical protein